MKKAEKPSGNELFHSYIIVVINVRCSTAAEGPGVEIQSSFSRFVTVVAMGVDADGIARQVQRECTGIVTFVQMHDRPFLFVIAERVQDFLPTFFQRMFVVGVGQLENGRVVVERRRMIT